MTWPSSFFNLLVKSAFLLVRHSICPAHRTGLHGFEIWVWYGFDTTAMLVAPNRLFPIEAQRSRFSLWGVCATTQVGWRTHCHKSICAGALALNAFAIGLHNQIAFGRLQQCVEPELRVRYAVGACEDFAAPTECVIEVEKGSHLKNELNCFRSWRHTPTLWFGKQHIKYSVNNIEFQSVLEALF